MGKNHSVRNNFVYNNIEKKDKNFMYKNLERSNCYNCNFSRSNFDYVTFRGAHFKSCVFSDCTFKWAEFIGTNLKSSDFKDTIFENAIFDSVNLDGADFKDAEFKNTIFLNSDLTKAKNLSIKNSDTKVFSEMPEMEISEDLRIAIVNAMKNKYVKAARVLDTKDGGINVISLMILLENFDEETLIKGLNIMKSELDCDFYTLSYIVKFLKNNM
ncbi:pentapeptide repeat-containing protein [Clostridium sp. FP1]|uniref:pentapeptide repeat-containing protein n=1 Tax=Clostridium sp. FP1 TaxID=2724076 RepID=UPI0013E93119|nr:pentapeptide repeat-containing protein [Clostridium sp. FP1]MBZ9634928.1 pentapeptide repeat-containing protein [Clostridium sp. FP1]